MPQASDAFLAELGLQRAAYATYPWSDDPGHKIWRAGLTHAVMSRMLESAEALAPFVKFDKAVVFGCLRDLVIEESERSPFGPVERDPEGELAREAARFSSMSLQEIPAEWARLADGRHGPQGCRSGRCRWMVSMTSEPTSWEKAILADHVMKAAGRDTFRYVAAILLDRQASYPKNGSGTCIAIGGRRFVATAAHVLKGVSASDLWIVCEQQFSTRSLPVVNIGHSGGSPGDQVDVGYIETDPQASTHAQESFLPLERLMPNVNHAPRDYVYALGFPNKKIPLEHWERGIGLLNAVGLWLDTVDPSSWMSGYLRDRDIVLEYPENVDHFESGLSIPAPEPFGVSGAGVWRVDPNAAAPLWTPTNSRLIGIERSWRKSQREIYATQIQHWLDLVSAHYPDLRAAIAAV